MRHGNCRVWECNRIGIHIEYTTLNHTSYDDEAQLKLNKFSAKFNNGNLSDLFAAPEQADLVDWSTQANNDGSSSDVKPSAPFSALMAPTEKFFKFIFKICFNNVAFINQIPNLQGSHFQIGSLHVYVLLDSRGFKK